MWGQRGIVMSLRNPRIREGSDQQDPDTSYQELARACFPVSLFTLLAIEATFLRMFDFFSELAR